MSWIVYADGGVLARSGLADPTYSIASPEVKTELNKAGSFQFTIFPMHPYYDLLIKMKTKIDVVINDETVFSGRVLYTQTDLYKQRKVYCEGCLSYLLDTIQESYEFNSKVTQFYDMTVYEFLDRLIVRHDKMFITDKMGVLDNFQSSLTDIGIPEGNTDTTERLYKALKTYNNESGLNPDVYHIDDDTKLFKLGVVNAEGTADRFKFEIKGHQKTLDMILDTLVSTVGGFMRAYRDPDDGWYVLEWRDKFGNENMQPIEFGTNLIELQQDESGVETFTRLYPSGKPSTGSGVSTAESTICLRETQTYFPVPSSLIVYDEDWDTHEPGTELTNPKASNFCEKDGNVYVTTQDETAHDPDKQYYIPIYGNPLTLKVDEILNYTQVYMGEFNAISVRIDSLGLNGNVDIAKYPELDETKLGVYDYEDGTVLVTLVDQNGVVYEDSDEYIGEVRQEAGSVSKMKSKDTEKRIIHTISGDAQAYHNKVNSISETDNPHDLGYYEYVRNVGFVVTSDTSPVQDKSYYVHAMVRFIASIVEYSEDWQNAMDEYFPNGATPASMGYFEVQQYGYVQTQDTKVVRNKNYYTLRSDPVHNEEKYGVIVRAVEFSDVNGVNDEAKQHELYRKAVDYIQKNCTDLPEQITLTAIDLRNLDVTIDQMSIGRDIHVKSKPHEIDRHMKCISIDYYLDSPEKNVYVISSKPTGSDAIPKFTEQAETKRKKGSGGSSDATGGTGGSYGGGKSEEQTEEEIAVLKNHVFYTSGDDSGASVTGSYYQLFAKALGMQLDEQGNPLIDIDGNWAWDEVSDASTRRNSIITKLDLLPNAGTLISTINANWETVDKSQYPSGNPHELKWYELVRKVDWYQTEDEEVVSGKTYYNAGHRAIESPSTAVYQKVSNTDGSKPADKGWYVLHGSTYDVTTDSQPVPGTTYYEKKSPKDLRWREQKTEGNYKLTDDTSISDTKTYYINVNEGQNSVLLSSKVEVTPGSVLIESISDAYYEKVSDPTGDPKTQGWYAKDSNGNYRKTDDRSVVPNKDYYTRKTGAEGSIEVTPGDVLIQAINQNGGSTAKIAADKITLQGDTTVDGILKVQDNALIVDGGGLNVIRNGVLGGGMQAYSLDTTSNGHVTIGTGGYLRFLGTGAQEYYDLDSGNVDDIIIGFGTATTEGNQTKIPFYTVKYPTEATRPSGNVITFNRATTPVLSDNGGWSSGVFSVTSNPAASNQPITARVSALKIGTISKGSGAGYIVVPVEVLDHVDSSGETPVNYSTGYSQNVNVNCSDLLEAGSFTSNSPSGSPYTPSSGKIGFSSVTVNVSSSSPSPSIVSVSNATNRGSSWSTTSTEAHQVGSPVSFGTLATQINNAKGHGNTYLTFDVKVSGSSDPSAFKRYYMSINI